MPPSRCARLVVVERDRLVGAVAARHHERAADVGAEQVMERRVREHQAEPRRCPARPTAATGAPSRRAARARSAAPRDREQRALLGVETRASASGSARHHGERLLLAVLARAQPRDGGLVGRVAGEVVAAEALDRERSAPSRSSADRLLERQREPRPAGRARDRLGVEAAVGRILVLARGSRGTAGSRPSSCSAGRTARRGTIVKRGPQFVQLTNG